MKVTTEAQQELNTVNKKGEVEVNLPVKQKRGHNLHGRPKGTKNKTTLFKEAMQGKFEVKMNKQFHRILQVLADKAEEGDMAAIKMIMDRVIPQSKAIDLGDLSKKKGLSININVGSVETEKDDPTVVN